jgi:Asp-tRNA(Asn)/Glu-tRNA(Gln) amidotransferase A subunit family amidase
MLPMGSRSLRLLNQSTHSSVAYSTASSDLHGVPAVSLPLLEAGGLPLGVRLVARRGGDGRLRRSARRLAAEPSDQG